jgi:hypothetical protein
MPENTTPLGLIRVDQCAPFHAAIVPNSPKPVAVQDLADEHDTAKSLPRP